MEKPICPKCKKELSVVPCKNCNKQWYDFWEKELGIKQES